MVIQTCRGCECLILGYWWVKTRSWSSRAVEDVSVQYWDTGGETQDHSHPEL